MPAGLTYTQFVALLTAALPGADFVGDAGYAAALPTCIDAAELRILRDIDLLATRKYATTPFQTVAPGNALVAPPTDIVVPRYYGYYTPAAAPVKWIDLTRKEESFLRMYWPNRNLTAPPKYFAVLGTGAFLISPSPDAGYLSEMGYTSRPAPLSASAPSVATYISANMPDLFFAAAMIWMAGFRQNYGAQSDDPKMAVSWTSTYNDLKGPMIVEEARRKAEQWADHSPSEPPSMAEARATGG